MRLGAWSARLKPGSFAHQAYGQLEISERHRHRYEFNREYEEVLVAHGLDIVGVTPDETYVEIVEIRDHPWFLGCQFHPEFKSRPLEPHPLFKAFIGAAYRYRPERLTRARTEEASEVLQPTPSPAAHQAHAPLPSKAGPYAR
jgi:CTP synthase